MKHAIITVDLGYGDAGKGTIVDALVREHGSRLVVRYNGGAQAAHNVVTDTGVHHTFSQFGAGTLAGASTLLSRYMLVNPLAMLREADRLREKGFTGMLDEVYVDERALVTTPYHRALNRLREMSRAGERHGSCGMGIGETMAFALANPNMALRVGDLLNEVKLAAKLTFIFNRLGTLARELPFVMPGEEVEKEMSTFDVSTIPQVFAGYDTFAKCVHILPEKEVAMLIDEQDVTVFEGAQGVMLDENYGFHPYTTWSTTTAANAKKVLRDCNYKGSISQLGIIRTYATRHGAGPFVTEDAELSKAVTDTYNVDNPWQQRLRSGWLDLPMLRYALDVNGKVDSLAVTHFDVLTATPLKRWKVCTGYTAPDGTPFNLRKLNGPDLNRQERITEAMMKVTPVYEEMNAEDVPDFVSRALKTGVSILSHGPKSNDKQFLGHMELV